MSICEFCDQETTEVEDCVWARENGVEMKFLPYHMDAIPYGNEANRMAGREDTLCHDCYVIAGNFHHPGCDVEECPYCEGRLIVCVCEREAEIHE